jgi:hypothetical protein
MTCQDACRWPAKSGAPRSGRSGSEAGRAARGAGRGEPLGRPAQGAVRLREGPRRAAGGRVPAAPLSVGPRLSAPAVYPSVFQHVPVERAQGLIADLTGGLVSAGFALSCLGKVAGLVTDAVRLIRTLITAPVAGSTRRRCSPGRPGIRG